MQNKLRKKPAAWIRKIQLPSTVQNRRKKMIPKKRWEVYENMHFRQVLVMAIYYTSYLDKG